MGGLWWIGCWSVGRLVATWLLGLLRTSAFSWRAQDVLLPLRCSLFYCPVDLDMRTRPPACNGEQSDMKTILRKQSEGFWIAERPRLTSGNWSGASRVSASVLHRGCRCRSCKPRTVKHSHPIKVQGRLSSVSRKQYAIFPWWAKGNSCITGRAPLKISSSIIGDNTKWGKCSGTLSKAVNTAKDGVCGRLLPL